MPTDPPGRNERETGQKTASQTRAEKQADLLENGSAELRGRENRGFRKHRSGLLCCRLAGCTLRMLALLPRSTSPRPSAEGRPAEPGDRLWVLGARCTWEGVRPSTLPRGELSSSAQAPGQPSHPDGHPHPRARVMACGARESAFLTSPHVQMIPVHGPQPPGHAG